MELPAEPRASIIVCTRNRPAQIGPCIESILASDTASFELLVIDQSDGRETEEAVRAFANDPRVRLIRTDTRGLSRARNIGIDRSSAPLLIYTDDDCRAHADWLRTTLAVFDGDPKASLMFGRVVVPAELLASGSYTASFEPDRRVWDGGWPTMLEYWGIGANMAFRREVFEKVGRFDPFLGAGTKTPAAEELDLEIRALDAGLRVINARESVVTHLGVREGGDVRSLWVGYALGIGAAFGKNLRLGSWKCRRVCLAKLGFVARVVAKNLLTGVRPTQGRQLLGVLRGAVTGLAQPIDKKARVFAER